VTWLKFDDNFMEHPKIERAGGDAGWLWVCAIGYASRHWTDGLVPETKVPRLSDRQRPMKLAEKLCEVGLWHGPGEVCDSEVCPAHYHPVPYDAYVIHDYWGYQPTRAEAEKKQEEIHAKRSEAGKLGAHNRWHADSPKPDCEHCNPMANGMANAMANAKQTHDPDPTRPDPTRARDRENLSLGTDDDRDARERSSSNAGADSHSFEVVAQIMARLALEDARRAGTRIASDMKWLGGALKNIRTERADEIRRALDGRDVEGAATYITRERFMVRKAMRDMGLTPSDLEAAS
jgi:hypothetical protein